MPEQKVILQDDADVVAAWKQALTLGRGIRFNLFKQACLSGAVLELCRQVIESGGKGVCVLNDASDASNLRACIVIEGCPAELLGVGRGRLSREINVGPALPAVKLHQVAEVLQAEASGPGARVTLTIQQNRSENKAGRRPVALVSEKRR